MNVEHDAIRAYERGDLGTTATTLARYATLYDGARWEDDAGTWRVEQYATDNKRWTVIKLCGEVQSLEWTPY